MQTKWFMLFISLGLVLLSITRLITWLMNHFFGDLIVKNPAAIFGQFSSPLVVGFVVGLGFILLVRLILSPIGLLGKWGVTLLLVGGLSNLYDRLMHGGVIDYIPLGGWSTFNLADVEIILGAVFLALDGSIKPSSPAPPIE